MLENLALIASTALIVRYLPKLRQWKLPVHVGGYVKPGFEEIEDEFRRNFEKGPEVRKSGSGFAVYHNGERVVNLYGGYADADILQLWRENTLSLVYSTTKVIGAICIAKLVDEGLLEYQRPVADYWPEFGAHGKGDITVQQLMEHKAALPVIPLPITYGLLRDHVRLGSLFADMSPSWKPGTAHGYHAVSIGPLTSELLRRVDPKGRTLGKYFDEEIAKPFGIDFFIGLPLEENHRTAKLICADPGPVVTYRSVRHSSKNRTATAGSMTDMTYAKKLVQNAGELRDFFRTQNNPEYRAVEIASANGFGTAEALAKLMGILAVGGTDPITKKALLSKERVDSFLDSEPETTDKVIKIPIAWKNGMAIDHTEDGVKIFGHPGAGGQVAFTDLHHRLGYAFTSRYAAPFGFGDDPRFKNLQKAMYRCVKKLEES
ncbi:beta-lactamase domain-containing protein 2-like isoform X1 [Lytechinus variegatus]|uniref:beta-lactamase domain-containing protein 2-like isoform X1 n=1 Tax=Lytechinus variegatus TaxID=7654 RepID=UPI001BB2BB81|nr:beta-lactamase domain-containing protein 2-like isoform X1 [Lytechinus variegatus]